MGMKPRLEDLHSEMPGCCNQSKTVDEFATLPPNLVNQIKREGQPLKLKGTDKPGGQS